MFETAFVAIGSVGGGGKGVAVGLGVGETAAFLPFDAGENSIKLPNINNKTKTPPKIKGRNFLTGETDGAGTSSIGWAGLGSIVVKLYHFPNLLCLTE